MLYEREREREDARRIYSLQQYKTLLHRGFIRLILPVPSLHALRGRVDSKQHDVHGSRECEGIPTSRKSIPCQLQLRPGASESGRNVTERKKS